MIFVAFLFPIAVYLFVIGVLNRGRHPILVSATWDFAGVLLALSGFLAIGGPAILSSSSERWRDLWLSGRLTGATNDDTVEIVWRVLSILYFIVVVGVCGVVLWKRRTQTSVYNVDPETFIEVLEGVLASLGLKWSRSADHYILQASLDSDRKILPASTSVRSASIPSRADALAVAGSSLDDPGERTVSLALEMSPLWRNITMTWETADDPSLREQIESQLKRALTEVTTRENPVSVWMLGSSLLIMMLTLTIATIALLMRLLGRG